MAFAVSCSPVERYRVLARCVIQTGALGVADGRPARAWARCSAGSGEGLRLPGAGRWLCRALGMGAVIALMGLLVVSSGLETAAARLEMARRARAGLQAVVKRSRESVSSSSHRPSSRTFSRRWQNTSLRSRTPDASPCTATPARAILSRLPACSGRATTPKEPAVSIVHHAVRLSSPKDVGGRVRKRTSSPKVSASSRVSPTWSRTAR